MERLNSPATTPPNEAGYLLSFALIGVLAALLFAVDTSDLELGPAKAWSRHDSVRSVHHGLGFHVPGKLLLRSQVIFSASLGLGV